MKSIGPKIRCFSAHSTSHNRNTNSSHKHEIKGRKTKRQNGLSTFEQTTATHTVSMKYKVNILNITSAVHITVNNKIV